MAPQSLLLSASAIAAARRGQAIRRLVFYWGFFYLTLSGALAQNVNPEAQRLFQQADTSVDLNQKIRLLESALRLAPQYAEARLELAQTLIQAQQFRRAIFQLDTVLSTNIKNAEAWFYKGRAHTEIGENNTARKSFERALVLYLELGKAQLANQSFDAALQSFERGIEIAISTKDNAKQAEAWFGKGRAHEAKGDTTDAARSYRQTLRLQPDFKEARTFLTNLENQARIAALYQAAEAAFRRRDWTTAARNFRQILVVDSNFKDVSQKLAIAQNKINAQALADSAQALRKRGVLDEAKNLLQQAITYDPENASILQDSIKGIDQEKFAKANGRKSEQIVKLPNNPPPSTKSDSEASTVQGAAPNTLMDSTTGSEIVSPKPALKNSWILAGGLVLLLFIFVFFIWQKYRRRPQEIEPTKTVDISVSTTAPQREELPKEISLESMGKIKEVALPKLDKYRFEQELGRGGMGRVYKACHIQLDRPVAIKVIRFDAATDAGDTDELISRFRREAKATAKLDHSNIVRLYDYDEKDGIFCMIMEYVDGLSLEQALKKNGRFPLQDALNIINQTCLALAYAHEQGVVHRDIKPPNIMLTNPENKVKVVDFGVAKMLASTPSQVYTLKGMRLGSPSYMSPEQIEAQDLDGRTDIYSLGVVFYELLTGERPFQDKDGLLISLFNAILNNAPPKLSAKRPEVPLRIEAIVEKMLEKKPEQRYQNAAEIIKALRLRSG